jgi:hypothetical protein
MTCPSDEDLAAFLDGRLAGRERQRVVEHLAGCARCFELFCAVTDSRREEQEEPAGGGLEEQRTADAPPRGGILLPFLPRGPALRWAAALAATALVAVPAALLYRHSSSPATMTTAELVEPLRPQLGSLAGQLWEGGELRGAGDEGEFFATSFLLGVHLVDLRAALEAGDARASEKVLDDMTSILAKVDFFDEPRQFYQEARRALVTGGTAPAGLLSEAAAREDEFADRFDEVYLSFGKWAEAGRLSAIAGDPRFFRARATGPRFRRWLARELEQVESESDVLAKLRTIDEVGRRSPLGEDDFAEITVALAEILNAYDQAARSPSSF